jgi:imidazole glycerol phosphate synthase subunit HisF
MKTKINFRLSKSRKSKRCIGCLDVETGLVHNTKDNKLRHIDDIEKYDSPGFFETYDNGKLIQKKGKYEKRT